MLKALALIRALGPVDLKSIVRDSMLLLICAGPILLAALVRWSVPLVTGWLDTLYGIDLIPFYPLIMSLLVLMAPALAGTVMGFLLLDERDEKTLLALLVTPIPLPVYLVYRLGIPIVLALVVTPLAVTLAGLVVVPPSALLWTTLLASLSGATVALLLVSFAENKVTGIAVLKVMQGIQALPLVAYFFTPPLEWVAGIVPSYWPLAAYWRAAAGQPIGGYLVMGFAINAAVLVFLVRRYEQGLRR